MIPSHSLQANSPSRLYPRPRLSLPSHQSFRHSQGGHPGSQSDIESTFNMSSSAGPPGAPTWNFPTYAPPGNRLRTSSPTYEDGRSAYYYPYDHGSLMPQKGRTSSQGGHYHDASHYENPSRPSFHAPPVLPSSLSQQGHTPNQGGRDCETPCYNDYTRSSSRVPSASPTASPPPSLFMPAPPPAQDLPSPTGPPSPLLMFADAVALQSELNPRQVNELHVFAKIGASLSPNAMFMFLLLQQASIYQLHNKIDAYQVQYELFQTILQDVLIRLEASFALSKSQLEQVIAVTKDLLYNYKRTVYMDVHLDVEAKLLANPEKYGITNIAGKPGREALLRKICKIKGSSIRNQIRCMLVNTTSDDAKKRTTSEAFTIMAASKFKEGGLGAELHVGYQMRDCLLRRFAREAGDALKVAESESIQSDDEDEDAQPPRKRRKGRVAQVGSFFALFDAFVKVKVEEWGTNYSAEPWRIYMEATFKLDHRMFGAPKGVLLVVPGTATASGFNQAPTASLMPVVTNPGFVGLDAFF